MSIEAAIAEALMPLFTDVCAEIATLRRELTESRVARFRSSMNAMATRRVYL